MGDVSIASAEVPGAAVVCAEGEVAGGADVPQAAIPSTMAHTVSSERNFSARLLMESPPLYIAILAGVLEPIKPNRANDEGINLHYKF
jgi:hypothetical protein